MNRDQNYPQQYQTSAPTNPLANFQPPNPNRGLIGRKLDKWKWEDNAKTTAAQRESAENMLAVYKAVEEITERQMTYGMRVQMQFLEADHCRSMMEKDRMKADLEIERMKMENNKLQVECQMLYYNSKEAESSAKIADMEAKARMKAMQQEYGDDF